MTARHSESIKLFTSKIVDTNGKWLLKTPLKDTERREIMSLFELMKFEVDAVRQAIQEASKGMMNSLIDSPKLESAISSHVYCLF